MIERYFNVNPYNLAVHKTKLRNYLIGLNAITLLSILYVSYRGYDNFIFQLLFLVPLWLYLLLWYIVYRRVLELEELRQMSSSSKVRTNKRTYKRYDASDKSIKVGFSIGKRIWIWILEKNKLAKLLNVSKSGALIKIYDDSGVAPGEKAVKIQIVFPDKKSVTAEGIIVRVNNNQCAIKFTNISHDSFQKIKHYISYSDTKWSSSLSDNNIQF